MAGQHHRLSDLASERALAGDMRRGQSLAVWAIREGRLSARAIDEFLMGTTDLPR
jgi:NADPH-dependent glutamate synthase beta subunit-like oxidoreductase